MAVLLCTFLSLHPLCQEIAQLPEIQQQKDIQGMSAGSLWRSVIKQETKIREEAAIPAGNFNNVQVSYKLFGLFPLKNTELQMIPSLKLFPGGQSIGVSLQTKGVMVVGQAPVVSRDGKKHLPGRDAGIEIGDTVLKINQLEVRSDEDVAKAIDEAGNQQEAVKLLIRRSGQTETVEKSVTPIFCAETGRYRIGLYVRDQAAGVGTMTFIQPQTGQYGALGHVINDADTHQRVEIAEGKIVASLIQSIEKGKKGSPGEKIGSFVENSAFSGTIEKNMGNGIFGKVTTGDLKNPYFPEPLEVGWASEVKEGPAKIYTVIREEKIEEFEVNIERVLWQRSDSKNMVIRVTDPRLMEETGGIIQGMSGSPIVQDGKIIGAVTHVFVNDSLRGYGVFIQNMLKDGGMLPEKEAA
ncbi:MAG: SpoIVB peptidase [Peptococcaceae bacterium]|jgi:stage IV sporulation protein B|nr:SpoIVB peptidase [Peptococcaceae bacterium]